MISKTCEEVENQEIVEMTTDTRENEVIICLFQAIPNCQWVGEDDQTFLRKALMISMINF
jgi:hypothetical protein